MTEYLSKSYQSRILQVVINAIRCNGFGPLAFNKNGLVDPRIVQDEIFACWLDSNAT